MWNGKAVNLYIMNKWELLSLGEEVCILHKKFWMYTHNYVSITHK